MGARARPVSSRTLQRNRNKAPANGTYIGVLPSTFFLGVSPILLTFVFCYFHRTAWQLLHPLRSGLRGRRRFSGR